MKIAFVGKGGSGKTTLASLFIQYLLSQKKQVLAVDSDINQHLGTLVNIDSKHIAALPPIGVKTDKLLKFLLPDSHANQDLIIRTTPPTQASQMVTPFSSNELFDLYAHDQDNLRFIAVGQPPDSQVGARCYHSNMGFLSLLLNHIIDTEDEYIIVDLTAGIDTVISGIFISYDIVFVAVEPTLQSIHVFNDYKKYTQRLGIDIPIVPIGNKTLDQSDTLFIEEHINQPLAVSFSISQYVRSLEKGLQPNFNSLEPESIHNLERIMQLVHQQEKNWVSFYDNLVLFHKKKAAGHPQEKELLEQIDPDFSITKVVTSI